MDESEAPTKRQIDQGKGPVRYVHRSNDVEILWYVNRIAETFGIWIGEFESLVGCPLARLKKRKHLAKYLRRISTVDLLDHDGELRGRVLGRFAYGFHEYALRNRELCHRSLADSP